MKLLKVDRNPLQGKDLLMSGVRNVDNLKSHTVSWHFALAHTHTHTHTSISGWGHLLLRQPHCSSPAHCSHLTPSPALPLLFITYLLGSAADMYVSREMN